MITERNAAFDFTVVFAPILLILVTCLTIFYRLRARWPVKVNCWFCNENTKIWRQDLDWWLCPWCEQYNGFSKDGDYKYDVPEQYTAPKVRTRYCRLSDGGDNCHVLDDKLCAYCNERESQKLLELSNFEPKSDKLFHTELKAFKEDLEVKYPLCDSCKSTVQDVLRRQTAWLTRYKMLFFRRKPIKTLISKARQWETLFRLISTILVAMLLLDFVWLPIGGLLFRLCICWPSFKTRLNRIIKAICIFLLFCITISVSVKNLTTQNVWLAMELFMQYRVVVVCVFAIDLFTHLMRLDSNITKNALNGSVAFKKIKLRSRDTVSPQLAYTSQNNNVPSEANGSIKPSVYTAGELSSIEIKFSKSHSAILRQRLSTITANDGINGYLSSVSRRENGSLDNCCLNDSLSTLLLSEDPPRYSRSVKATPAIFERRVYSATSSENLFRNSSSIYGRRRCILSPPKLRSVTQTSWVAGGYWQEGMMTAMPPTLSRSSSQSSGFGSVGSSNLAPSREPSVHEFDRCSVVSEATRWSCQTPRPGGLVSRHDSPVPRPQSRYSDVTGGHLSAASSPSPSPSPSPTIRAACNADDYVQENYARGPNVGERNGWVPLMHAGSHTTTVVTSPGWLSAMLCGSLILNMIVLCATLLR